MPSLYVSSDARAHARRTRWLERGHTIWLGFLFALWTILGINNLLHQDWLVGSIELATGTFVLVSGLYSRSAIHAAHQAERFWWSAVGAEQGEEPDPEAERERYLRHLMN